MYPFVRYTYVCIVYLFESEIMLMDVCVREREDKHTCDYKKDVYSNVIRSSFDLNIWFVMFLL